MITSDKGEWEILFHSSHRVKRILNSSTSPSLGPPEALERALTQRTGGPAPARRAVALEARGCLVAGAPIGTRVGGAGVLGCVGNQRRVWRPGPTFYRGPRSSPRCTPARGVGPAVAAPTYPAHSSCPSSRQGRRSGTGQAPR